MDTNTQPILEDWLASSVDAQKVALHWEGLFISASGAVIFLLATVFHVHLEPADYATLAASFAGVIGAVVFLWGVIRSIVVKLGTRHPIGSISKSSV